MDRKSLLISAGILMMGLSGIILLITWIQITYNMDIDVFAHIFLGVVIGIVGVILWFSGVFRGK